MARQDAPHRFPRAVWRTFPFLKRAIFCNLLVPDNLQSMRRSVFEEKRQEGFVITLPNAGGMKYMIMHLVSGTYT